MILRKAELLAENKMKPSERRSSIINVNKQIVELNEKLAALNDGCTHVDDNYQSAITDDGGEYPYCTICTQDIRLVQATGRF